MPTHHPDRATRRRRGVVALTVAALLASLGVTSVASADPAPALPPVEILTPTVTSLAKPTGSNAPVDFVVAQEAFTVHADFTRAISENKSVTLTLTALGRTAPGTDPQAPRTALRFTAGPSISVPVSKGATFVDFEAVKLATGANDVILTVTATAPAKDVATVVPGTTRSFDVPRDIARVTADLVDGGTVSRDGALPCTATTERPLCVDLVLPANENNGGEVVFTTGSCAGIVDCPRDRDLLQVLAKFSLSQPAPPATLVVKCDKSLCGGRAIAANILYASLEPTGALGTVAACTTKGVIDKGLDSCVDLVQSKRDGAGDTYLYWLVTRDARMSIG